MTASLFSFVGVYDRALDATAHLLDKGAAFAVAEGGAADDILGWRIAEDMHPLAFQALVVVNFSSSWTARAAGLPVPDSIDFAAATLTTIRQGITDAKARLAALTADQLTAHEDTELTVKLGESFEFTKPAGAWLIEFATVNILFHMSMAYAILRLKGVPLGKLDLFPGGL